MKKTLSVSDEVWAELLKLKIELRARSVDEVLRKVLNEWRKSKRLGEGDG